MLCRSATVVRLDLWQSWCVVCGVLISVLGSAEVGLQVFCM